MGEDEKWKTRKSLLLKVLHTLEKLGFFYNKILENDPLLLTHNLGAVFLNHEPLRPVFVGHES